MLIRPIQLLAAVAQAPPIVVKRIFPDPEPCAGNCSWTHDPNVYVERGTYHRFSTTGDIADATADDIKGSRTHRGAILEDDTSMKVGGVRQDAWAPNVVKIDDTIYYYYIFSYTGTQDSQLSFTTSTSLAVASWTDHSHLSIAQSPSYSLSDPAIFHSPPINHEISAPHKLRNSSLRSNTNIAKATSESTLDFTLEAVSKRTHRPPPTTSSAIGPQTQMRLGNRGFYSTRGVGGR